MPDPTTTKRPRTVWGWCRCSFRWCRIAVLAAILLTLTLLTWLRLAGLPDFLRDRIVRELAQRGVTADFSSLRFHWFRGLVAYDLRATWGGPHGPRIAIAEADLDVAPPPWRRTRELVRGIRVRNGSMILPLPLPDEAPLDLAIEQVAADVRFPPGDAWEIRRLAAQTLGLAVEFQGTVTNVSALRRTDRPPSADPEAVAERIRLLRRLVGEVGRWQSSRPPRLAINLHLDGRRPASAEGDCYLEVPEVRTPHGDLRQLRLSLRSLTPSDPSDPARAQGTLELGGLQTGEGGFEGLSGRLDLTGPPRPALPTNATWRLNVDHVFLRGLRARQLVLRGTNQLFVPASTASAAPASATNTSPASPAAAPPSPRLATLPVLSQVGLRTRLLETRIGEQLLTVSDVAARIDLRHHVATNLPDSVQIEARTTGATGAPGEIGNLRLEAELHRRPADAEAVPDGLGPWAWLWPYAGTARFLVENLDSPKLDIGRFETALDWQPPKLDIRQLEARLYGGSLVTTGHLDVATRRVALDAETTCDLHGIDGLLGPRSRENFVRYQWRQPPWFKGTFGITLPGWTDRNPDWNGEVKHSIRLDARFRVAAGGFKGVTFDRAESSLHFDGAHWRLPDLRTERPEGRQEISVDYNEDTREYRIDATGHVHPPVLRSLIGEQSAEVLDLFEFRDAVGATVTVWGPWTEGDRGAIVGTVAATNLLFRGQSFDRLAGEVVYTNRFLVAAPLRVQRGTGELMAEGAGYDFAEGRLHLTNGVSTIEPAVVAAAISPGLEAKLVHYRFDSPPVVRASGTLLPRQTSTARMAFDVDGGPFHFWRFSSEQIRTRLLWEGPSLILTNLAASFYHGTLEGDAVFDLTHPDDGRYQFNARVRNAALGDLLLEATPGRTNVAQGTVDLDLRIHDARTADLKTWNGSGRAELRDGLLWDAPIFGFLSPMLNAAFPGLGYNRARRADATFTITNGVIHTRDLVIACPPARLLYRGTVDFDQRVEAKVEGQILSDIAGVGPLFGLVLRPLTKLLEFRVTGTLSEIDAQPLYVLPKLLLLPLQPLRTLRNLFHDPASNRKSATPGPPSTSLPPGTNAPPANPPPAPDSAPAQDPPRDAVPSPATAPPG